MTDRTLLLFCLAIVFVSGLVADRVQTGNGVIDVREIRLPTQNGQWLTADLFRPRTATAEKPAPLVVVVPGFQRSKEALSNVAIELARRGVVSVSIDPYAQGGSSASMSRRAATTEGYGLFSMVDYVAGTSNLNYVDRSRIGATGHSAGGNAAIRGASYFGREALQSGKPSKLHSVFVSGYVLTLTEEILAPVRSNVGVSYALYDEGAYRNELGNGDMRRAPEALRAVNSGIAPGQPEVTEIELGRWYGDAGLRNLRVVYNERLLHPFQPYAIEAMANQIGYFDRVFGLNSGLSHRDQIWYWKELMGVIALIASLFALVPLGRVLLGSAPFHSLVHTVPPPLPRPDRTGVVLFWALLGISAAIACISYIPMAELSQRLFLAASNREQTWFFPQRMNNAVMLWAVLNGLVGFTLFWLVWRFRGRAHGIRPETWGIATNPAELGRTLFLALTIFACYFGLLAVNYWLFHVDYRFLFMGVRQFEPRLLPLLAMYFPFFFVFFLSNSLRVNGAARFIGATAWKELLLAGFANSLGLLLIVVVQYAVFAATGTVYWTDGWLYVNLLFGVVPMMFVLPYFNRAFFLMTGRIWLGPMVTCLVFVMILITNTVIYIPL